MKRNINKYIAVLVLITTLTACKVSKDVETPKDALPENFRNVSSQDTTSIADQSWKEFFTEPSLQKLIDSAIVRNNDLLIAQKKIEAAQWQLTQSKWGNVPKLNFEATATSTRLSDNSLNGLSTSTFLKKKHIEDYNAALNLSWEADIWGKIRSRKKNALAEYLQSEEAKKALQTTIVANVSTGFYNLLMLDAQLEIARKNLALNDSTLFVINLQYESGQVTSLAKQQAEAQQSVAAQLIPELEQAIALQENALSIITGSFPGAKERKTTLGAIALKENVSAGIPSSLVSRRPDVKNAELALKAANAKVGIAKASLYPSLNITAAGGLTSFKSSNWFNTPASLFGTVAGSLAQPLLNGRSLKAQYEISKIEREKAVLSFRQSVLVAVGEVADALVKVEKLKEQQAIAANRVTTLQNAVKNADMLFKSGMATYLEVIVAQGNLLQSELELATLKRTSLEADVELYRSLGGGWK
ncbi:efflux transporter outer membrane subunit [uncultured Flavobacterium sp.]|uniref:efflux transporter outer membrane subunit n=1 Tax=uncultured Flavobacterium sp. TaxID=165435 RepID=UPI001207F815|nr:efflux transporter outer membrane subunit [uncultured Flavobacterium sp.]THD31891.1 MAG: efflux transporter outer membrane subunit [Flavobacterium johnsoniae]